MSCCTCASWLDSLPEHAASEKPLRHKVHDCCGRVVCQPCLDRNPRFASACLFCPSTTHLEPPIYEPPKATSNRQSPPPPYEADDERGNHGAVKGRPDGKGEEHLLPSFGSNTGTLLASSTSVDHEKRSNAMEATTPTTTTTTAVVEGDDDPGGDGGHRSVTHHLRHPHDSVASLSLRYGVPAEVLRRRNGLTSDHLLAARRTVAIPAEYATSGSQSPLPVEEPEEAARKAKIRRFMMGCRCAAYDLAVVYLEQAAWDVDAAAGRWVDDEVWERENPFLLRGKGKGKGKGIRKR